MKSEVTVTLDVRADRDWALSQLSRLAATQDEAGDTWTFVDETTGPMTVESAHDLYHTMGVSVLAVRRLDPLPAPDPEAERMLAELEDAKARSEADPEDSDWHKGAGGRWVRSW